MKEKRVNIAIDGPSGVGKTIMATMLAKKLNYKFLSSGSFYRIIAYNALVNNLNLKNEEEVNSAWAFDDIEILDDDSLIFKGIDVTKKIREDIVAKSASQIAKFPSVRIKVNQFIQIYAKKNKGIIVDGRDATYRILPDAEVKFFMSASPEIRAKRRMLQDEQMGIHSNYSDVYESIKKRDYEDTNRPIDPLKVSEGSIEVDTSNMSIEENFEVLYQEILKRIN
ncbi:cytidylate kinase [Metamycoplasma arthritidis]|uniref:Cytidylate kinase n=1 Tax=Metamycoplasma arthritidis (strain 158L3-1) TaxID=243272 RepID=B3PME1_META1|nr:(d)CMP kinase [Metamycoplasma arthritidis]ACF07193.1 cytidylate kinase [Metamycoplasma arthritidis 158L3-1]VEU78717.1 cytidylate kinase [Metamycoplasma arthritidis]